MTASPNQMPVASVIEVQCSFRTDAFEGLVTIKILPDATIGNLKHHLLKGIKARPAPAVHFDMEYFKSLFLVQVSRDAKELIVWKASDDYGRIAQQRPFLESLQEVDISEQYDFSGDCKVKTKWKCSLLCCTQHELTAEEQKQKSMFSIGRIRSPSPASRPAIDSQDTRTRHSPPGMLRRMELPDMLHVLQQRWQPEPETLKFWSDDLYGATAVYNDLNCAYQRWIRIDKMMKKLQALSYLHTRHIPLSMAPQTAKKSKKLTNRRVQSGPKAAPKGTT